jgi:hypothetical protein
MLRSRVASLRASLRSFLPPDEYLAERSSLPTLSLLFLALVMYRFIPLQYPMSLIGYAALALAAVSALRPPRRVTYVALAATFLVIAAVMVFSVSTGPQDRLSDRDDGAETAAAALLHKANPWQARSILGLPITTGPTGIVLSVPSVWLTGRINLAAFVFWAAFLVVLLLADFQHRNRSFGLLVPLLLLPELAVVHTFYWSLEELYFPLVFVALAAWALARDRPFAAGACAACVVLGRLNYALAMAGLFFWMVVTRPRPLRPALRFIAGAALAALLLLLPFILTQGAALLRHNFVAIALETAQRTGAARTALWWLNTRGSLLNNALLGGALLLALYLLARLTARRTPHPLWHVSAGALLTQLTLFFPGAPNDYLLMVIGPALFAVAFTPGPAPGAESP